MIKVHTHKIKCQHHSATQFWISRIFFYLRWHIDSPMPIKRCWSAYTGNSFTGRTHELSMRYTKILMISVPLPNPVCPMTTVCMLLTMIHWWVLFSASLLLDNCLSIFKSLSYQTWSSWSHILFYREPESETYLLWVIFH